jgi:hypothetical protein
MNGQHDSITAGLNRLNALFAWWGVPSADSGSTDTKMRGFQVFASDLQRAYAEACSEQVQAMLTMNKRIMRVLQDVPRCRRPRDVIAVQASFLAAVGDGMSQQAKSWAELAQKFQDCSGAAAREVTHEVRRPATASSPAEPSAEARRYASKQPERL